MSEVTKLLSNHDSGDEPVSDQLLTLVYGELRILAARQLSGENAAQTLQPTALVHEAFLRLVNTRREITWDSRGHFFSAAAEAMRRILIDRARRRKRQRHGGEMRRVELPGMEQVSESRPADVLALDEALQRLELESPERARLVKLRYFVGMTLEEAALAMGISRQTACRHWAYAKAWLYNALREE